jgi:hypothetical protein
MELRDLAPDSKMDFPCHTGRSASISQTQIELNTGKNALIIPIRTSCGAAEPLATAVESQCVDRKARIPACAYTQQRVWVHAYAASVSALPALSCCGASTNESGEPVG